MLNYLCILATYLDPRFHGRGDRGEPEWPPSPLRLYQAIIAANADQLASDGSLNHALAWLECQAPPIIIAPRHRLSAPYCLSVPNNAMDLVAKAWSRGNYFGSGDANPATHRTMKAVQPVQMLDGDTVSYLWNLDESDADNREHVGVLTDAAKRTVALGWGIDLVVGNGQSIHSSQLSEIGGETWRPTASSATTWLRAPIDGTLDALERRHTGFLQRLKAGAFTPVEPLSTFNVVGYRRATDPIARPHRIFELRQTDGASFRYSPRKLIQIAGMVRHLAIEAMKNDPPRGIERGSDWVEAYVAGHSDKGAPEHRQLSYLPLPSVGHEHTDPGVRRVMIAAPVGDDALLDHVARKLAGQALKPLRGDEFGDREPPMLVPVPSKLYQRGVPGCYTQPSHVWHSFTPVILPGHDDHKPAKTKSLIERALRQSGIEQPCEFEWFAFSHFRKSFSAHKYGKDKRPQGYFRPSYLNSQTAVHLTLRFHDGSKQKNAVRVPGPLAIGAGRHCGLGLLVMDHPGN